MSNTKTRFSVGVMTRIAILTAIASILFLIEIPVVAFYKLDLSNLPVLLGAFSMGTVPGVIILALIGSALMVKPLNALLLGTRYARNLGINVSRTRNSLLLITGILTAVVTAYCGPIGFIGLVVPHIARMSLGTSNHARLVPATILAGADIALLCALVSVNNPHGIIPINAITPIIGVPIILYIILIRRRIQYFN